MRHLLICGALALGFALVPATSALAQSHYYDPHYPAYYDVHHGTYAQVHRSVVYEDHGAFIDAHPTTYVDYHHGDYVMPHYAAPAYVEPYHPSHGVSVHSRGFSFSYYRHH